MSPVRKKIQRLLVLFIFGFLALNYPLLTLFSKRVFVFGIPLLYFYLFALWFLFILFIGLVVERKKMTKSSFPPLSSRKTD
jgi:hypothetical protein